MSPPQVPSLSEELPASEGFTGESKICGGSDFKQQKH